MGREASVSSLKYQCFKSRLWVALCVMSSGQPVTQCPCRVRSQRPFLLHFSAPSQARMNQFLNLSHGRFGIALHASLLGCLAASDSLDTACSGFEATPVVDADHGDRTNREAGDAEAGAAASGKSTKATVSHPKASARLAAHGASAAASWWAEAPHARGSGLNASAISSSQNRMCGCSIGASPAAHDAHDSRWLQDSADSVAWAAHGMPESPHGIPRPG